MLMMKMLKGIFNYFLSLFVMSCTVKHMTLFIISGLFLNALKKLILKDWKIKLHIFDKMREIFVLIPNKVTRFRIPRLN